MVSQSAIFPLGKSLESDQVEDDKGATWLVDRKRGASISS